MIMLEIRGLGKNRNIIFYIDHATHFKRPWNKVPKIRNIFSWYLHSESLLERENNA